MRITVLKYDSLESTNTEAIEQAVRGAEEGLCVIARQQIGGRGRQGREWVSGKDSGLYFSIVLRPNVESRFLPLITLMAAVAVHQTLADNYNLTPDIKWSNDILINEKKISGILAETIETGKGLAVVVGIGINLNSSNFPSELRDTATSIQQETNHPAAANALQSSLIQSLSYFYDMYQGEGGAQEVRREWAKRSSYFEGKEVIVTLENEQLRGTTAGLDVDGALKLKTRSGKIRVIRAGDVERLR